MNSLAAATYFQPQKGGFWEWSKVDEVITWTDGKTICYTQDLLAILKSLQPQGLPPIEVILLVIAACQREWHTSGFSFEYLNNQTEADSFEFEQIEVPLLGVVHSIKQNKLLDLKTKWSLTLDFLKRIHALPPELRTGHMRMHLMQRIFSHYSTKITPEEARFFIKEFESGALEKGTTTQSNYDLFQELHDVFSPLFEIEDLETYVRTGLKNTPEPVQFPIPETAPDDLLTQLSQDHQTAGLAHLTKRLIAAINIPPHTQGASDQPLGGVSDISNRGDFDRLLLSELANDDDTLSARLVNNEALYLRRETPPDPQVQERVILVDTSLRLWGMPRVFAVSAALGCALNNHQKAGISAFALGKEITGPNPLATKEEVIHFLEQQSTVLHSGEALRAFFRQQPRSAQRAAFFITSEEVMADKNFSLIFAEQQQHLDYLLVLSRTGTLWFYKLVNGQRSLMSTSVFDLEELLFKQLRSVQSQSATNKDNWPHALKLDQFPLFIPMMSSQVLFSYPISETSALAVTINFELHFWPSKDKGSILIAKDIPAQKCWFGQQNPNQVTLLGKLYLPGFGIRNRVYVFNIEERTHLEINLDEHPVDSSMSFVGHRNIEQRGIKGNIIDAYFENENWFINTINGPEGNLNYYIVNIQHNYVFHSHVPEPRRQTETKLVSKYIDFNKIINNGYSIHYKINTIGISRSNWIKLNDWEIQLSNNSLAFRKDIHNIRHSEHEHLFVEFKPVDSTKYGLILKNAQLNTHVEAFIDNRGFLYLRTTDQSLPEVCITLVSNREMAAYASDHTYTGNRYFIPEENKQFVHPVAFYQTYIQPYIKLILQL